MLPPLFSASSDTDGRPSPPHSSKTCKERGLPVAIVLGPPSLPPSLPPSFPPVFAKRRAGEDQEEEEEEGEEEEAAEEAEEEEEKSAAEKEEEEAVEAEEEREGGRVGWERGGSWASPHKSTPSLRPTSASKEWERREKGGWEGGRAGEREGRKEGGRGLEWRDKGFRGGVCGGMGAAGGRRREGGGGWEVARRRKDLGRVEGGAEGEGEGEEEEGGEEEGRLRRWGGSLATEVLA
jgi:hypothetical protein